MKEKRCKNCGHKIRNIRPSRFHKERWFHTYSTITDVRDSRRRAYHLVHDKRCKCGCMKPEPKGD